MKFVALLLALISPTCIAEPTLAMLNAWQYGKLASHTASAQATITTVQFANTGGAQSSVPVTFGQVFKPGDLYASSNSLVGDISGVTVPLQLDIKATHADGSLRHAIISAILPSLPSGQTLSMALKTTSPASSSSTTPAALLANGFTSSVNIAISGVAYTASADTLLAGSYNTWLSGQVANEWQVTAPLHLVASPYTAHAHLQARFAIRAYGASKARVDVTVENNWAYEPSPQNITYDASIVVGGSTVYPSTTLKHYHHARWRKTYWWGGTPAVDVKLNLPYLIATKAVPNYDQTIVISSAALTSLNSQWVAASSVHNSNSGTGYAADINLNTGPMGTSGIVNPSMPATGGHPDIGPLPRWSALYLLSGDTNAKNINLSIGDLAGSWPTHYRDKISDLPVNVITYPNARIHQTLNIGFGNTFYPCVNGSGVDCTSPFDWDSAHQPSLAYLPYLITGDYYYLEELQFWATWNMVQTDGPDRTFGSWVGLPRGDQIRGQAWTLRTLGQVAYITPDAHSMKSYWVNRVNDNAAYLNSKFVTGNPNPLGIMSAEGGFYFFDPILYTTPLGANTGYAPWQDDFFTWSMGYLVELGFSDAAPMLAWKAKNPVGRMIGSGVCYVDAAAYYITVRPTSASAVYATQADVWTANFGTLIDTNPASSTYNLYYKDQACGSNSTIPTNAQALWITNTSGTTWVAGRMKGGVADPQSYLANLQPALAVSVASGIANAQAAWDLYSGAPVHPPYESEPQFAIVPR